MCRHAECRGADFEATNADLKKTAPDRENC
jgi:hypothetical protein